MVDCKKRMFRAFKLIDLTFSFFYSMSSLFLSYSLILSLFWSLLSHLSLSLTLSLIHYLIFCFSLCFSVSHSPSLTVKCLSMSLHLSSLSLSHTHTLSLCLSSSLSVLFHSPSLFIACLSMVLHISISLTHTHTISHTKSHTCFILNSPILLWMSLFFEATKWHECAILSSHTMTTTLLRRVYTSGFRMRFPHCIAIFYYLPWLSKIKVSYKKLQRNAVNACGNRMCKLSFTSFSADHRDE